VKTPGRLRPELALLPEEDVGTAMLLRDASGREAGVAMDFEFPLEVGCPPGRSSESETRLKSCSLCSKK
jgi:hypothetical protein